MLLTNFHKVLDILNYFSWIIGKLKDKDSLEKTIKLKVYVVM